MRATIGAAFLLLFAAFAADAPADEDKPAAPKKKDDTVVYAEDAWLAKVRDISNVDVVGVKKTDVLTRVAAKAVVTVRVKIWDIRSTKAGLAVDIVDIVPRGNAEHLSRDPIVLFAEDREAMKDWKRWDRLTFKVKPKVTPDGFIEYTRLVSSAADVDRTPNPGIEYFFPERPLADLDEFGSWTEKYSRACCAEDWKTAWKHYSRAASVAFPMSACVRQGAADPTSGRTPRGPVTLCFDIAGSTGVTDYGLLDSHGHPCTWAMARVDDPQAIEALQTGARAVILLNVKGLDRREDVEFRKGRFRVDVAFGRVK